MTSLLSALALLAFVGCKDDESEKRPKSGSDDAIEALENERAPLPEEPLERGDEVFDFSALAHNGQRFKLSAFLSRPVLVYFCSEGADLCEPIALSLRDNWLRLNPSLSMAFGVSANGTFVNRDFASLHQLPHLLVSDPEARVHQLFGIPPASVKSYLIGTDRKVLHVFTPPDAAHHASEVLSVLEQLGLKRPDPPM